MVNLSILPLVLKEASVYRHKKRLIGPITTTIEGPGCTILMGPNGAGKSTLLRLMHGMEKADEGARRWNVDESTARKQQAFVFQTPVMMRRSVCDNIAYPLIIHGVARKEARLRAEEWAERVGLLNMADRQATVLSGGERQKLSLARALIRKPDVLFLDEPCANLDGRATREIESILLQARADGTRLIMATHDFGQAQRLADEVIFLFRGVIVEFSPAKEFFETPRTTEASSFLRGDILE